MKLQSPMVRSFCRRFYPPDVVRKTLYKTVVSLILIAGICPAVLRAERVGFQFSGALQVAGTGDVTLFGISVPKTAPVTGTFSYDTTAPGNDSAPGVRAFHQDIFGGLKLNINHGAIQLSASDYFVTVSNDIQRTPDVVDIFSVDVDSRWTPKPAPILVNGIPWSGTTAFVKVELSWPSTTFTDPEEPKLTFDRPLTPNAGDRSWVGSTGVPRIISFDALSAIVPPPGDFNYDGRTENDDYFEWKHAFSGFGPEFLYADGNFDGAVDSADYTVWRDHLSFGEGLVEVRQNVPEASSVVGVGIGFFLLGFQLQRRKNSITYRHDCTTR